MDSSSHIKIHDEVDDQVIINNSFDTDLEKHHATLVQKKLMANQANFFKIKSCFENFKHSMIQAGSIKQVNDNQVVATPSGDPKEEKIKELELKLQKMEEEARVREQELAKLRKQLEVKNKASSDTAVNSGED